MVDINKSTRRFLSENPIVEAVCKAFGKSAKMVVSEARETGRSIDAVLTEMTGHPVQIEAVVRSHQQRPGARP